MRIIVEDTLIIYERPLDRGEEIVQAALWLPWKSVGLDDEGNDVWVAEEGTGLWGWKSTLDGFILSKHLDGVLCGRSVMMRYLYQQPYVPYYMRLRPQSRR